MSQFAKLLEGQWIDGKYQLLRLLGQGSFGHVFEADNVVAGRRLRKVAVKLLEPDERWAREQMSELAAAVTLDHPHLLRCYDVGHTRLQYASGAFDIYYLVMELASGTLDTRLRDGLLGVEAARVLALQIGDALSYLRVIGKVHRDVKPDNILRVGDCWKLADVGILRDLGSASAVMTARAIGARAYMPPEALLRGEVSPAWDVWSLGATLLEALTGRTPYFAESDAGWRHALEHREPDIPADLPAPFDAIVPGCLTRDARNRWTAAQVLEALRPPSTDGGANDGPFVVGPGAAFATVQDALDAAPPGATVTVKPGVYRGSIVLRKRVHLTADGAPADVVLSADSAVIVANCPEASVRGFSIHSSGRTRAGGAVEIQQGRLLLDRCDISGQVPACIKATSADANPIIRRCRIRNGQETGIWFTAGASGIVEECEVVGQSRSGIWIADDAHPVIRRCVIHRSRVRGVLVSERGRGVLDRCVIAENFGPGLEITKGGRPVVHGCCISGNERAGVRASRGAVVVLADCDLRGNRGGAIDSNGTSIVKSNVTEDDK